MWEKVSENPTSTEINSITAQVSWLQSFCDNLVESSLTKSIKGPGHKQEEDSLLAEMKSKVDNCAGSSMEDPEVMDHLMSCAFGSDAHSASSVLTSPTKLTACDLLNPSGVQFDVDELLRLVDSNTPSPPCTHSHLPLMHL